MSRVNPSPRTSQRIEFERSHSFTLADYITGLSWSADGSIMVVTSSSGETVIWSGDDFTREVSNTSRKSGEPSSDSSTFLLDASINHAISCLEISSTHLVAAAGQDGTVSVWDGRGLNYPKIAQLGDGQHWITQLTWHPSGNQLAFAMGHQVQIWDIPKNQQLAELHYETSSVLALAWHPAGNTLAMSGHGGVTFWNGETWEQESYQLKVPGASISVAWSPDGEYLASGNLDRTLSVLRWGSPPPWLMQGFPGKVRHVEWVPMELSPSPQIIAVCANGITVWSQKTGNKDWQNLVLQGHEGTVQAIAHHPALPLLASGSADGRGCLWKQSKKLGQRLKVRSRSDSSGVLPGASCLAWHPTGKHLAIGCSDGRIEIWSPSQRGRGFL
ncbi:MAG: WD40 repeat domain-containing protein [Cyanobacteria bacterium J06633_2]